jgi:acyl carrier protein
MLNASKTNQAGNVKTKEEIQNWLIEQIAGVLFLDRMEIDIRAPFTSYGLSSRDAVVLSGDLEEWLDRRLSPTLIYEYPNIEILSGYLSGEIDPVVTLEASEGSIETSSGEPVLMRPVDDIYSRDETATKMGKIADLEKLSEEEAEAMLLEKLDRLAGKK